MNLLALKKAIVTATSRSRSSRGKQGGNNAKDKEEVEEIKPLIVCKKVKKAHIKKSEKELVVDVDTLSFRPADGRLQTARRGRPWVPGNLCGHRRGGGGVRVINVVKILNLMMLLVLMMKVVGKVMMKLKLKTKLVTMSG